MMQIGGRPYAQATAGDYTREVQFSIQDALWNGLQSIAAEQLSHGEFPNYRRLLDGSWEYYFSPLVSASISHALACFDPLSNQFDLQSLELAGERYMQSLGRTATQIRRGIYRFLRWQQCADGTWRFLGRGSGVPADLDTTSCCAAALLDRANPEGCAAIGRIPMVFSKFPMREGLFDGTGSRGAGPDGTREHQRVGNVNALWCLAMAGCDYGELASSILKEFDISSTQGRVEPVQLYALGRAYRQGQVASLGKVGNWLVAQAGLQQKGERYENASLSAALTLSAWLDFSPVQKQVKPIDKTDLEGLINLIGAPHNDRLQPFGDARCGSAALTTAIAMSVLARAVLPVAGGYIDFAA